MATGAQDKRVDVTRAFRDAGITTLLAFGLFLPLVGFETTTNIRNDLILTTRWPLLFAVVAVVGVGRLAYSFLIEPWLSRRALRPIAATSAWRAYIGKWFTPFAIGFVVAYPAIVVALGGIGRAVPLHQNPD